MKLKKPIVPMLTWLLLVTTALGYATEKERQSRTGYINTYTYVVYGHLTIQKTIKNTSKNIDSLRLAVKGDSILKAKFTDLVIGGLDEHRRYVKSLQEYDLVGMQLKVGYWESWVRWLTIFLMVSIVYIIVMNIEYGDR